ncbi:ArsR/SmtB family transcription factor [Actinoplanes couchii]|uniref:Transcriptional regulator n=1 Tax=Actinoplanes couchii TaxID=403638 RepID=A0ABQ3XM21_9ACTN|nr:helix-turn-helix domain-containing protein [Actinoplanes couchii]MDR6319228.1 DNA-binding MarR family transcriptional regulator [Actinoplanes couchii]GID59562.1 transcriptional regulator [Actinoplanes couchii]
MSLESGRRKIGDPTALRALTHPLRIKLHALVGREGTVTAAEAARQLGVSQALASHHLRQLAKYGFVEPADAGDNRERPWRVTATSYQWDPGDSGEAWEQVDLLERFMVERAAAQLADWQQRRAEGGSPWAQHTGISQNLVYLTPDEMADLARAWDELITPLVRRRPLGDAAARPAGALPVDVTLIAVPVEPTATGG